MSQHFASRPENTAEKDLPTYYREKTWPLQPKPEHAKVSAYFNLDNGTGRIRGIYAEENAALRPDLRRLARPLRRPRGRLP